MAKICINQNCKKEIPSSATFCSFCGTQQVEDIQLSEEEKLRKEMSEMQETIALLKKALADAQQNSDSSAENLQEIANLQKRLAEVEEKEKKTVEKNTMPKQRSIAKKKRFLFLWLGLVFATGGIILNAILKDSSKPIAYVDTMAITDTVAISKDTIAAEVYIDRHKIENIIRNYSQYIVDNNFQGLRELYAPNVKRYHAAYNKDREDIINRHKRYDDKYGVYGKRSSIRWNTLSIKRENDLFKITYIEDYSIDSDNPKIYKNFVLEKHLELSTNYQIVSVYDIQQSRSK
jgi:hypothetical protein